MFSKTVGIPNWMTRIGSIDLSGDSRRVGNFPPGRVEFADEDVKDVIASLPHLFELCATRTGLTDAAIPILLESRNLKVVFLYETDITDDGIRMFQQHRQNRILAYR